MIRNILLWAFLVLGIINFIQIALYVIGANIYDIKQFKNSSKKHRRKGKSPLVSVIIPAYNESLSIERCLDSIRRSTYRKFEIIVHNDHSTDETAKIVRNYQKKYPKLNLRLINRQHNSGKAEGVNYSIKRWSKGDLIMTLDADCVIHRRAIKKAVDHFDDETIAGVAANVKIMDHPSILGLLQKFEHLVGYRTKKFYTVANCEFIVGGVASTYRREILDKVKFYDTDTQTEDIGLSMKIIANGNKKERIIYASDVVAMTEPVYNFSALLKQRYRWKMGMIQNLIKYISLTGNLSGKYHKSLTLYRVPIAFISEVNLLIEPFLIAYLLYLSIKYHTVALFLGAYLTISIIVFLAVWQDEHTKPLKKLKDSAYAPIIYFVFYIMNLVQVIAILQVLVQPKKVFRKTAISSRWISPARSGKTAKFA